MIKKFKQFLKESTSPTHEAFHTSADPINHIHPHHPMWLSLNKKHALGYHRGSVDNHGSAHTYSATVTGNIAHHNDEKVKKLFKDAKIDQDDYTADLTSNPTPKETTNHKGTKLLQKHGYHGYIHPDYDPSDSQKDIDTMVVFKPADHVKLGTKIKET